MVTAGHKKNVELVLLPASRCKGSRIALSVETSNAESPTPMLLYDIPDMALIFFENQNRMGYVYKHPRGVLVALFLTDNLNLRDSYIVKTKALR